MYHHLAVGKNTIEYAKKPKVQEGIASLAQDIFCKLLFSPKNLPNK